MEYISVIEAAERWNLTSRRVQILCSEGRIEGAKKIGKVWVIPEDVSKPIDGRTEKSNNGNSNIIFPIKSSVKAKGHTPQYKMHKYFARRPYNVFNNLIKHYTKKGDIVLDCFCGGGVTIFEAAALGRKPIGVDINPLAAFITRMQMFNGDVKELEDFYRRFLLTMEKLYKECYKVSFPDDEGYSIWTEWAYVVKCPECGEEIVLIEQNKISNGIYMCPNPTCKNKKGVKRVICENSGSYPIRTLYYSEKSKCEKIRELTLDNINYYKDNYSEKLSLKFKYKPEFQIPDNWDRQYEDKLFEKGIINYSDFFTKRNYEVNCVIFNEIMKLKETASSKLNEYLYFLFSSSLRYTNKMTRVSENWENGKPTAMDKHAFWLPNQYIETNVLNILANRMKTIIKGCEFSSNNIKSDYTEVFSYEDLRLVNGYLVLNRSSSELPLPDCSVDVVITDPPYGSNVQYAELSSIWNAWYQLYAGLDNYIYNKEEAVVNRKHKFEGAKTEDDYEFLLKSVFSEAGRVLKNDGYLIFTFNNKNIKVWIAMLKAVALSGFYLPDDGLIFQDYIDSYKNTAHLKYSGNVQGDFIYSFKKGTNETSDFTGQNFTSIISDAVEKTIKKLYTARKKLTTPVLYQKLMANLTTQLMQYIVWCVNNNIEIEEVRDLSNDYLENILKKYLVCKDGEWEKR